MGRFDRRSAAVAAMLVALAPAAQAESVSIDVTVAARGGCLEVALDELDLSRLRVAYRVALAAGYSTARVDYVVDFLDAAGTRNGRVGWFSAGPGPGTAELPGSSPPLPIQGRARVFIRCDAVPSAGS